MSGQEPITATDLLDVMAEAGVLEIFCRLPKADQEEFSRWIGKSRSDSSHWRRIDALVLALGSGPMDPRSGEMRGHQTGGSA